MTTQPQPQPEQETQQPGYIKLFEDHPVYEYEGQYYQLNNRLCPFNVTAVQPDPYFPGWLDITDAIINVTWKAHDAVIEMARERGDII